MKLAPGVSDTQTLVKFPIPVFLTVPLKEYLTLVAPVVGSLTNPAPVQVLVMLAPHSGNDTGGVRSLKVAVGEFEERVSAMKVLKQGRPPGKITLRSTPPSSSSPL